MKRIAFALLVILGGCFPPLPQDQRQPEPSNPEPEILIAEHPPAELLWKKLAQACEGRIPLITNMARLRQYVGALYRLGDFSDSDIRLFDERFPDQKDRPITSADIEILKGLK